MKNKMKQKLKSEIISDFLKLVSKCERENDIAFKEIGIQDKLTVDLLHEMELESYDGRQKTATALAHCRQERRYYKDIREEAEILSEWAKEYEKALNMLREALGQMRKVEKYHSDRTYFPRVLQNIRRKEEEEWKI